MKWINSPVNYIYCHFVDRSPSPRPHFETHKNASVLFLSILKWKDFSGFFLNWSIDFPSASCKTISEENLYICSQLWSCTRQIAMVNIWDSSYLLCYLIDGHMSFPHVHSEGLQSYKESKIIAMLSTFCCKQVCGDIKLGEGMPLGQV